jgi:hypothetical protein
MKVVDGAVVSPSENEKFTRPLVYPQNWSSLRVTGRARDRLVRENILVTDMIYRYAALTVQLGDRIALIK